MWNNTRKYSTVADMQRKMHMEHNKIYNCSFSLDASVCDDNDDDDDETTSFSSYKTSIPFIVHIVYLILYSLSVFSFATCIFHTLLYYTRSIYSMGWMVLASARDTHMCVLEYSHSMNRMMYAKQLGIPYAKQFLSMKKRQSNIDIRTI